MLTFKGIMFQVSSAAPHTGGLTMVDDFYQGVFARQSAGVYTFKSPSFLETTKVFLPLETTDDNAPLIHMFDGNAFRGHVSVCYAYESSEGTVYIKTYDETFDPADDVLVNFPLCIEAWNPS